MEHGHMSAHAFTEVSSSSSHPKTISMQSQKLHWSFAGRHGVKVEAELCPLSSCMQGSFVDLVSLNRVKINLLKQTDKVNKS